MTDPSSAVRVRVDLFSKIIAMFLPRFFVTQPEMAVTCARTSVMPGWKTYRLSFPDAT